MRRLNNSHRIITKVAEVNFNTKARALLTLFFSLVILSFQSAAKNDNENTNMVELRIGEAADKFSQRYPSLASVDHQPAGLSFYKASWGTHSKGRVKIAHAVHSFELPDVLNVMGTEGASSKQKGIFIVSIHSGISCANDIMHKDALDRFYNLLRTIQSSGWRSSIPLGLPRLNGKDMFIYYLESKDPTTLDADYKLSLQEWMNLDDLTNWEFYADGVFMRVTFMRDQSKMDPEAGLVRYQSYSQKRGGVLFRFRRP